MKRIILILVAMGLLSVQTKAQYHRCGTDAHQAALEQNDPSVRLKRQQSEQQINKIVADNPNYKTGMIVTIPVVFHILYTNAAQNISDNYIFEQLDVLNDDFARLNADAVNTRSQFQSVGANTQIQFCLAQRTPAGAATNGIVRVSYTGSFPSNPPTVSPEWDHTRYLNIYVGDLGGGLLGYANFPPGSVGNDHVVLLYSAVGGPNLPGSALPYHLGRTATHEIGHYFNLYHTFESGCAGLTANNCTTSGDRICDTPPVGNPTFGCPTNNPNTCTETSPFPPPYTSNMVDMYENYMDYSDDACMNIFTLGQSARMNAAITGPRSLLITSLGCTPVGMNELLDENAVTVMPNPSPGMYEIALNLPSKTKVEMTLTDVSGKIIFNEVIDYPVTTKHSIDITNKSNGIYQLRIQTANGYLMRRLVKL